MFLAGANGERHKPSPTQIELVKSEWNSVLWDCSHSDCPTSNGLSVKCGTSVPYNTSIHCVVCELGKTYSNTHGYETCKDCLVCKENQVNVSGKCTLEEDTTKCQCKHGYYEGEDGECKMNATTRPHVNTPGRHTTAHSANKSKYIGIGIGVTCGIIAVILFFILILWHKCPAFKQAIIRCIGDQHSAASSEHTEQSEELLQPTEKQPTDVPPEIIVVSHAHLAEPDCDSSARCEPTTPELHSTAADDHVQGTAQEGVRVPDGCLITIDENSPQENATQSLASQLGAEASLGPNQHSGMSWNLCNMLKKNSTVVVHSESEMT